MTGQPEASSSSSSGVAAGIPSAYTTINTPSTNPYGPSGSSTSSARLPAGTTLLGGDLLAQQGMYLPGGSEKGQKETKKPQTHGQEGRGHNKRETVIRKGNGKTWEDPTLLDWDPSESLIHILLHHSFLRISELMDLEWFRLFVGDVSNDVNERTLDAAFSKYPSYCKSKVVRDRLSEKVSPPLHPRPAL